MHQHAGRTAVIHIHPWVVCDPLKLNGLAWCNGTPFVIRRNRTTVKVHRMRHGRKSWLILLVWVSLQLLVERRATAYRVGNDNFFIRTVFHREDDTVTFAYVQGRARH